LLGKEWKSGFNLEDQNENGRFEAGHPDWELLLRMELKSRCNLEDYKENGRFGAGRPDWELCWGWN